MREGHGVGRQRSNGVHPALEPACVARNSEPPRGGKSAGRWEGGVLSAIGRRLRGFAQSLVDWCQGAALMFALHVLNSNRGVDAGCPSKLL